MSKHAMTRPATVLAVLAALSAPLAAWAQEARRPAHDYPTAARADYVVGCLASNGFKRELLQKCSCGIDTIADLMTYEEYVAGETVLAMRQNMPGPRGAVFRDTPQATEAAERMGRAQAEVNLRCS